MKVLGAEIAIPDTYTLHSQISNIIDFFNKINYSLRKPVSRAFILSLLQYSLLIYFVNI